MAGETPWLKELDLPVREKLRAYVSMVENAPMNLTAWRGALLWERGIAESLGLGSFFGSSTGEAIDIGSGGGFPGMVLAIAYPEWRWTLLDARKRRVEFLQSVADRLALNNVHLVSARAEEWIRADSKRRESFDAVTMRAVSPLYASLELGLPFVALGGSLLLAQGPAGPESMAQAEPWVERLGGGVAQWIAPAANVRAVAIAKVVPTPSEYPRGSKALGRWRPAGGPETTNSSPADRPEGF